MGSGKNYPRAVRTMARFSKAWETDFLFSTVIIFRQFTLGSN
jgi:hypothetical protein